MTPKQQERHDHPTLGEPTLERMSAYVAEVWWQGYEAGKTHGHFDNPFKVASWAFTEWGRGFDRGQTDAKAEAKRRQQRGVG